MKKLIILLALMLVSLSAAGCGNSDQQADDPSADTESKSEAAAGEFESEDIKLINGLYDEEQQDKTFYALKKEKSASIRLMNMV